MRSRVLVTIFIAVGGVPFRAQAPGPASHPGVGGRRSNHVRSFSGLATIVAGTNMETGESMRILISIGKLAEPKSPHMALGMENMAQSPGPLRLFFATPRALQEWSPVLETCPIAAETSRKPSEFESNRSGNRKPHWWTASSIAYKASGPPNCRSLSLEAGQLKAARFSAKALFLTKEVFHSRLNVNRSRMLKHRARKALPTDFDFPFCPKVDGLARHAMG